MDTFAAIDFETANNDPSSLCCVGIAVVSDGILAHSEKHLIRPPDHASEFHPRHTAIHGITPGDVARSPSWSEVFPRIRELIPGRTVVAHNAAFDSRVFAEACGVADIDLPDIEFVCTLQLSRQHLSLPSYSLPWVVEALGLPPLRHHDAEEDALAAAQVMRCLSERFGLSLSGAPIFARPLVPEFNGPSRVADVASGGNTAKGFDGEFVCFTGKISIVRNVAKDLVEENGGVAQQSVTKDTTLVVTGDFNPASFRPGQNFSRKLKRCFELQDQGQRVEILTEDDFYERLEASREEIHRHAALQGARHTKLPQYVIHGAQTVRSGEGYWEWFRRVLKHPDGRAEPGSPCIWCAQPIRKNSHWIYRDRHVCSGLCNEGFKRSAKRAWAKIPTPDFAWDPINVPER